MGKKLTLHYTLIQGVYILGYCTIFSFGAVFFLSRGFTNSQVGLTFTLASALTLAFQPLVAAFADRTRRISLRGMVAVMLAGVTLASLLLLIAPAVLPTAVLYTLLVILFVCGISLVTTLSIQHINNGVPINFSLARGVGSLTFAVLSFSLGYLVDRFGTQVILLANIGIGLVCMALVLTFPQAPRGATAAKVADAPAAGFIEFALRNRRFTAIVGCVSLIFISHVLINTYAIQIIRRVGGGNAELGTAVALAGLLELPAMALFPWIYKKHPNAGSILKVSGAFFVLKSALTWLAPSMFWIYFAQVFQFFAYALITPASVFFTNEEISPADQNKGQTLMGMSMGLSNLLGSLAGGAILDSRGGVPLMLFSGTAVALLGLVLLLWVGRRHAPANPQA